MSAVTLLTLETTAIILSSLSGLFGVYLVVFTLAIWSTYRQGVVSSKRLRWVTIVLFIDLLIHFTTRSLQFARARLQIDTDAEMRKWTIPLVFLGNITTTISGLLSDATLAWRFYVVFNRERWALYLPTAAVALNACLCWSADFEHLAYYSRPEFYLNTLLPVTMDIAMIWGWSMFFCNSLMTGGIIYKIVWANNGVQTVRDGRRINSFNRYATALRAIIESAFVTWVGILLCEIGMLGPSKGHVVLNQNLGDIMLSIIPVFFGISQSLITARLGLIRESRVGTNDYPMSPQSQSMQSGQPRFGKRPTAFSIYTNVTTHTDFQGETKVEMIEEDKKKAEESLEV